MKLKILFTILLFALTLNKVHAESISLAVDPPILQINAIPPADIKSPLIVENRGDSRVSLSVSFKPFTASDQENGQITYINESLGIDIKLLDSSGQTVNQLELLPKEKKKLVLSITIPSEFKEGDHYFSVIFVTDKSMQTDINSSQSRAGIAANVLLSVGNEKVTGEISEFSAPLYLEKGPVPLTVRVKNNSNRFITPKGEILIKNIFGQTIGRVDLAQVNILANSVRSIPSQEYFDEGKNLPDNLAAYWPQGFLLGPYKATLSISLSDTGPLFKRSVFFFAFPLKGLIAVVIGLLLITYITTKVRSKI